MRIRIVLQREAAHSESPRQPRRFPPDRSVSDDADGLATQLADISPKRARAHPFIVYLRAKHEVEPVRICEHRGYGVFADRGRMNSTARGHRNAIRFQRANRVIGAGAEELDPFELRRAILQIVRPDKM